MLSLTRDKAEDATEDNRCYRAGSHLTNVSRLVDSGGGGGSGHGGGRGRGHGGG